MGKWFILPLGMNESVPNVQPCVYYSKFINARTYDHQCLRDLMPHGSFAKNGDTVRVASYQNETVVRHLFGSDDTIPNEPTFKVQQVFQDDEMFGGVGISVNLEELRMQETVPY